MVLLFKMLDDHWDALKAREGEVSDLRRKMEELNAAGQATTEEIGRLKEYLGRKLATHLIRKEEVVQLRGELEKNGSEMLKRDSELQQKESALLEARQDLLGMRLRAEEAEVALRLVGCFRGGERVSQ